MSCFLRLIENCSIVAVHGILENGLEAWTDINSGTLWLRDLFPHERYHVRVLLYHYNVEAFLCPGESSADRILPFANSLVDEFCADRQLADAFKRPIIFVCHGFGGLLVKRALAFSSTRRAQAVEHLRSVFCPHTQSYSLEPRTMACGRAICLCGITTTGRAQASSC